MRLHVEVAIVVGSIHKKKVLMQGLYQSVYYVIRIIYRCGKSRIPDLHNKKIVTNEI